MFQINYFGHYFFFSKNLRNQIQIFFFKPTLKSRFFREICHKMISVVWIDAFFFSLRYPPPSKLVRNLRLFYYYEVVAAVVQVGRQPQTLLQTLLSRASFAAVWRHRVKLSSVLQRFCCNSGNTRPGLLKAELLEAQPARREIDYYVQNIIASQRDMTKPGP